MGVYCYEEKIFRKRWFLGILEIFAEFDNDVSTVVRLANGLTIELAIYLNMKDSIVYLSVCDRYYHLSEQ